MKNEILNLQFQPSAKRTKKEKDGIFSIKKIKVNRLASATFEYVTSTQLMGG